MAVDTEKIEKDLSNLNKSIETLKAELTTANRTQKKTETITWIILTACLVSLFLLGFLAVR